MAILWHFSVFLSVNVFIRLDYHQRCIPNANRLVYHLTVSFLRHWMNDMVLGMHIGLTTHHHVPKWAISKLIADSYALESLYLGYLHPQWEASCILSHQVLFVTLPKLHGVGYAHRLPAKPELRHTTMKFSCFWRFLGHLWTIRELVCRLVAYPMPTKLHIITLCPICGIGGVTWRWGCT